MGTEKCGMILAEMMSKYGVELCIQISYSYISRSKILRFIFYYSIFGERKGGGRGRGEVKRRKAVTRVTFYYDQSECDKH